MVLVNLCKNWGSLPSISINTADGEPSGLGEIVCNEETTSVRNEQSSCRNSIGQDREGTLKGNGVSICIDMQLLASPPAITAVIP